MFSAVQDCQMIAMFKDQPGTIWGFEDVRLPYVQAARESAQGQQPLRMPDMWEAIGPVLDGGVYLKLISEPKQTVKGTSRRASSGSAGAFGRTVSSTRGWSRSRTSRSSRKGLPEGPAGRAPSLS
jgi:hypothetical protein